MDFTKKVNDFGLFGSVLVVNNDIMESATKTEDKKEVLMIAARITSRAVSNQVKDGKLTAFEGLLAGMGASDSTNITPNLKDIKLFTEAVIKTAEDGNMKDYVHETGNNIPQEIWDCIYKLTNDK